MRATLAFLGCHRRAGVERVMLECANYLDGQGHETHVFASDWEPEAINPGVHRHHVDSYKSPSLAHLLSYSLRSAAAMRKQDPAPDVRAGYGVISPDGAVVWVTSVHRAWLEISAQRRGLKGRLRQKLNLAHPLILWFERRCYGGGRYAKLLALSETVKSDLMRFYNVPAEDILILPNGFAPAEFNLERFAQSREPMRKKLGYGPDDRVVIFVANELERKGFGPLLNAIIQLEDPHIHLLAVGRLDPNAYQPAIARAGLTNRVHFTGPTNKVAEYYAAADVFALPTQYEAWGLVIVEAMACGLPALTSRLAGAALAIQEGSTGNLLDDPNDSTEIAAKLRPLLNGAHAAPSAIADSVQQYAWPHILARYEQILQDHCK